MAQRRSRRTLTLGVASLALSLLALWVWLTQPVVNYQLVWPLARVALGGGAILLALITAWSWLRAPDQRQPRMVSGVALAVLSWP